MCQEFPCGPTTPTDRSLPSTLSLHNSAGERVRWWLLGARSSEVCSVSAAILRALGRLAPIPGHCGEPSR